MKNFLFFNLNLRSGPARAKRASLGQSMVEMALTLPILMTIIAGTVEVTNLLTVYNQVQLAAREAARLASQGGPDTALMGVIQNTSTGSAIVDPTLMRVWVVRPVIECNADPDDTVTPCTGATAWVFDNAGTTPPWGVAENCIYPTVCTGAPTNPITAAGVLSSLNTTGASGLAPQTTNGTGLNKTTLAIVVIRYEANSLLNLRWFGGTVNGRFPLYASSIGRQEVSTQNANQLSGGCSVYPLAISSTLLSTATEGTIISNVLINQYNSTGTNHDRWGFVGFLPGDGQNQLYTATGPTGSIVPPGNSLTRYQEPGTPSDITIHRQDYVAQSNNGNTMNFGSPTLTTYLTNNFAQTGTAAKSLNQKRAIRVIVYAPSATNPGIVGGFNSYTVQNFAIVRISTVNDSTHLSFEFLRWDASCGFNF